MAAAALVLVVAFSLTGGESPRASAQEPDPEKDRAQLEQLGSELEAITVRHERARSNLHEVEAELAVAKQAARAAENRANQAKLRLAQQAADIYRSGGRADVISPLLGQQDPESFARRMEYLDLIVGDQVSIVTEARQAQHAYDGSLKELERLSARQREESERLRDAMRDLDARFREVEARVKGFGAVRGDVACPLAEPYTYIDSWGFARSGGRAHQGTDILAPHGTPVFAFTDGVISRVQRSDVGLGGLYFYLQGDDGNEYYGAHLAELSVSEGERVRAGQPIGVNGDSGNAKGTPHLHFEVHPGGGRAVNPFSWVERACG